MRPLDSSVLQQHVPPLDVCLFFDRLCCLWTRLFHNSLCRLGTCVSSMAACAALERVSSLCFPWTCPCVSATAVCNVLGGVWPAAACLCFKCAYLFTAANAVPRGQWPTAACAPSVLSVCKSLCCTWTCLITRAFVLHLHGRVCLQELRASHGRVWLQELGAAPGCVCLQKLCAAPGRACLQEFLLHLYVSVYKNFVTHLDVSANKSAAQAVTVGVLLKIFLVCFGLFRNSSVCFGCFDIDSKHRNKPKYFVFGFTKQTETNAKQILFRFVSVRTEIYFCLFRGHPIQAT